MPRLRSRAKSQTRVRPRPKHSLWDSGEEVSRNPPGTHRVRLVRAITGFADECEDIERTFVAGPTVLNITDRGSGDGSSTDSTRIPEPKAQPVILVRDPRKTKRKPDPYMKTLQFI